MNSSLQRTDDDVLIRVENVSKKFCKSLKRSLWYGVKDIAAELNPFSARNTAAESSSFLVPSASLEPNQEPKTTNDEPTTGGNQERSEAATNSAESAMNGGGAAS